MRNYDDPKYKQFRSYVRNRDKHRCQMPGCNSTKKLKVHHIIKWSDSEALRYNTKNGILLCRKCHDKITGHEELYRGVFMDIVARNESSYKS